MHSIVRAALAAATLGLAGAALAQGSTMDEIARYREMLADGNPAELLEVKGEGLWKKARGPKNASLEQCDMGLGPGKLEGAYAQLPRYFADTRKVMDAESRLVHCMVSLQGFTQEEATKNWYSKPGRDSDIEALITYIGAQSNGQKINVPARHPEEARMAAIGEYIFYRRSGPQDFSCAICHGQEGKRIRLQDLPDLTKNPGDGVGIAAWPAYRVSNGQMWGMQLRLNDCFRQQRFPYVEFGSELTIALATYMGVNAQGAVSVAPAIKR